MFCPNCAAKIEIEQKFCRSCGLKLEALMKVVSGQIPTKEHAKLQKRKELFEKLGIFSLSSFGLIGICFLIIKVAAYKMILFGENAIFWSGFAAFVIFGLLAVFSFNYPKLFMKLDEVNPNLFAPEEKELAGVTEKLLPDASFEPIPSVTENTTGLLYAEQKTKKFE
jgi:hypothetical protein